MFKNNCEVGQKFDFPDLIIPQFFLSYVGLWSCTGHTEYSLVIFQKRSINTFQVTEEALSSVAVIQ